MSDVRQWLDRNGLIQLADVFEREQIDLDAVRTLSEADLKDLGLPVGLRSKLRAAIHGVQDGALPSVSAPQNEARASQYGERRQLTILFCDLAGSTALSAKLDPEALGTLMREYQKACTEAVSRYEGHVAQYLGDGLMVYFGWPTAHEDDASRAVLAALGILATLRQHTSSDSLRARIGIATGTVVVGQGSDDVHGEGRLAVGETPNLAARLQAVASVDEIVIAPSTRRLIGDSYELSDMGDLILKGILEPVRAFKVLGARRVEGRFEASRARQLTPLIGRDSEIALLLDRWERAKSGEGQTVMLSAEAGLGKSRITRALRERIAAESHTSLHHQCSPFHSNSAFYPIIELCERAAEFHADDTPDQKLDKLEALLRKAQSNISDAAPLYARMLSLPTDRYPVLPLSPQQQKERTMAAQIEQVTGLAAKQPVFVVLEDAHWADASTLETFGALLGSIESARVLIIITYRPEFTPPRPSQSRVTTLSLARLSRRETASLADRVSGKPLPSEVLDQILIKTDGVPLFVEELTKAVLESGLLTDAGDRYIITGPLPPLAIPSSLHDSLMARLDRLAPVKELIQLCAVIGREFNEKLIASLSDLQGEPLHAALDQLVASELVFKRGAGVDAVYMFKHALVQDAAYESILKSRRQQLHANVANKLEHDAQLAQGDPGLLAQHFDKAGLTDKAVQWYMEAGQKAKLRSANKEALHHFERALALVESSPGDEPQLERRIDLQTELCLTHMTLDGWASERALAHFAEAEKFSRDSQHTYRRFRTLVGMIASLTWRARASEAKAFLGELSKLAEASEDRVHRLFAYQVSGQSLMYQGKFADGLEQSKRAIDLYDERADSQLAFEYGYDPGIVAIAWSGYMQWLLGAYDSALLSLTRSLQLSRGLGHPYSLACALQWMVDVLYSMGLSERIQDYASEGLECAERHGFLIPQSMLSFHQGWAFGQQGHFDLAIEQMARALEQFKSLGVAIMAPRMTAQLARVYGQAGRADEGLQLLRSAPDRQPGRSRIRYAETSRIEGELHLLKTDPDTVLAEQFFREAIDIAVVDQAKSLQLRAATSLAKLWRDQGKMKEARALLQPLYDSFTEGFTLPDMKNARVLLESRD